LRAKKDLLISKIQIKKVFTPNLIIITIPKEAQLPIFIHKITTTRS